MFTVKFNVTTSNTYASDNMSKLSSANDIKVNNDIYNTNIEIQFIKKIRDEKKFNSLNELVEQINKDKAECSK